MSPIIATQVEGKGSSTPDYFIFTKTSGCIYCDKAKQLLAEQGKTYEETRFTTLAELHAHVYPIIPASRVPSFPLILNSDGSVVGGFAHLREKLVEPILAEHTRYSAFPIQHLDIYTLYKQQVACFWTSEEITLRDDVDAYDQMSDEEQHFLSHVLGFFAQADSIVLQNLMENFMNEVTLAESKMFFSIQAFMESEHSIVYSQLIDSLIRDPFERAKLFDAVKNIKAIGDKAAWAMKWLDKNNTFATRLVAYACVEAILFSGSFAAIYWLKNRGVNMPGLSLSNQFIARDEKLHTEHSVALYKKLLFPLDQGTVHAIIREAVQNEKAFILEALPCSLIGMNAQSMGQYIEYVADRLAIDLGYARIFGADNPFQWMENLGLQGKTNFFEGRNSEYARATVSLSGPGNEYQSLDGGEEAGSDFDDF